MNKQELENQVRIKHQEYLDLLNKLHDSGNMYSVEINNYLLSQGFYCYDPIKLNYWDKSFGNNLHCSVGQYGSYLSIHFRLDLFFSDEEGVTYHLLNIELKEDCVNKLKEAIEGIKVKTITRSFDVNIIEGSDMEEKFDSEFQDVAPGD